MVRSKPQLEALEGRELLSHSHVTATVVHPGAGSVPSTLVSTSISPAASSSTQATISNGDVQPFLNTVLSNGFARQLSLKGDLRALFNFVGQKAGEPGFLPFLDRDQDGVINRSDVVVLAQTYLPPFHLLRVT